MFRKLFESVLAGHVKVLVGSKHVKLDNSYVHNLIHGFILAAEHLVPGGTRTRPGLLHQRRRADQHVRVLPTGRRGVRAALARSSGCRAGWSQFVMSAWQWLHFRFGLPKPLLEPLAVERLYLDNYFSIAKARRDLGYAPLFTTRAGDGRMPAVLHRPVRTDEDRRPDRARHRVGRYCPTSDRACARRNLPDGVFGMVPGASTTTLRGRTSTSANTSCATARWIRRARRDPRRVRLDGDGERLPPMAGVQSDRDGTPGPHPFDPPRGPLDVRRIDVAPAHDDDVLDPSAHHDVRLLGQVTQIAGVVPALLVLSGQEPRQRGVTGRQRARRAPGSPRRPGWEARCRPRRRSAPPGRRAAGPASRACGCCPTWLERPCAGRRACRHPPRRSPVRCRTRRTTPRPSSRPCRTQAGSPPDAVRTARRLAQVLDDRGFDLLGPRQRPAQRRQVELTGLACLRSRFANSA